MIEDRYIDLLANEKSKVQHLTDTVSNLRDDIKALEQVVKELHATLMNKNKEDKL